MNNRFLLLLTVGFGLALAAVWLLSPSVFGVTGAYASGDSGTLDDEYRSYWHNPDTKGLNITLAVSGTITGTVLAEGSDDPIDGIHVEACDYNDDNSCWWAYEQSDVDGSYLIKDLPAGQYRVQAHSFGDYWIAEFYSDTVVSDQATAVSVTEGITTPNINFQLELGGAITGTVTSVGGNPQYDLWVQACLFDDETICHYAWTDADGSYSIIPLPAGNYRVMVEQRDGWKREYYDDTPYEDEAVPVTVNPGLSTTGIDFILEPGGTISGWVRDADGDPIIDDIHVAACDYDDDDRCWWSFEQSDVDGSFTIPGMATGEYRVQAYSFGEYWIAEFYDDTVDYDQATTVSVTEGFETVDINFELAEWSFIYLPLMLR